MRRMFTEILTEQGVYSSVRCMSWASFAICLAAAIIVTIYLIVERYAWPGYESFLAFCGAGAFGGIGGAVGNKYVNGRFNSQQGVPYYKGGAYYATSNTGRTDNPNPIGTRADI